MRRLHWWILALIGFLVVAYGLYLLLSYRRLPDNLEVSVQKRTKQYLVPVKQPLSILSYNIGFGAYTPDYSFFMDGGKQSRAFSRKSLLLNLRNIVEFLSAHHTDFVYLQEVDDYATRTYHVDERRMIERQDVYRLYDSTYGVNYDSPYLFYPILRPHGKTHSGLLTLSRYPILTALRRSLPIQKGFAKYIDLDRCYVIHRIQTQDGHFLCLYHFHLSAYTTDPNLANRQLEMLFKDMLQDQKQGNYIIAGGDFNKDLLGNSGEFFKSDGKKHSSVSAFPFQKLPEVFKLVFPYEEDEKVATCRNAHEPYIKNSTYVQTIDGFILSRNVKVEEISVINTEFAYSDHNPIQLRFHLKGDDNA